VTVGGLSHRLRDVEPDADRVDIAVLQGVRNAELGLDDGVQLKLETSRPIPGVQYYPSNSFWNES
jgi:hypothetical protein